MNMQIKLVFVFNFLLVPNVLIGVSLKDLGKKWFAFSKMDNESFKTMEKLTV